jgi:myo-inositol-1-phosphate synthase
MPDSKRIRVAIAGVGNCACSLVQAPLLYREGAPQHPGLAHTLVGPYAVSDLDFVAAFEVDDRKVGLDLSAAIFAPPNCTSAYIDVPATGVTVARGPLLDGLPAHIAAETPLTDENPADVVAILRESGADVLVCELPGGSPAATAFYAGAALEAGVAFVNCNPERIANDPRWRDRFAAAGVPLLGDDIKSQLGTTVLHRTLLELVERRGFTVDRSYQLNFGGNNDFLNMRDRRRFDSKQNSKLGAIAASVSKDESAIALVPPEYIDFLQDQKIAYIRIEATGFLGMKASLELRLNVEDSPNSAGVVVDAIRVAKVAADRGIGGLVDGVGSAFFKNPPDCVPEAQAAGIVESFIAASTG